MMLSKSVRVLTRCVSVTIGLLTMHNLALAQQVTYYDFDAPQANSGFSYSCKSPTAPVLCLNDGTGASSNPSFIHDTYPLNIDPDNSNPHYAVQMTPSVGVQAGSMWFSVPQKISSGFTSYFAFKITSNPASFSNGTTADGIAFVLQNAAGGGTVADSTGCVESGSGLTVIGGVGGCIGYGGIDNSVAIELDTFHNGWDPTTDTGGFNGEENHIAVQNCGLTNGLANANSPDHTGPCLVSLNGGTLPAINGQLPVALADGNVHEVVVEYSGPNEAVPNQLRIFIDPPFVAGTHTPTADAKPVIIGAYDIASNLKLIGGDSAYVGFTSATGGAFEQHEVLAWTFTPHTTSTQQQPLNPPGTPTVFSFGSHTFAVTYPTDGPSTANIDMIVTANTITPVAFAALSVGRSYAGSQCQVYDDTGGNCIVYSTECLIHGTITITPCPAITTNSTPITLKSAYNNTVQPLTPGFLQGDPLYSLLTSVNGDGTTATVLCKGECAVTAGQTVTLAGIVDGNNPSPFNGTVTVLAANPSIPNTFTFSSAVNGSGTGGYVASNNVQNIFASYVTQRIDGTTTGKTLNFSDFVVTSTTTQKIASTTAITDTPNPSVVTLPVSLAFTVSAITGPALPTGNYSVTSSVGTDNVSSCIGTLVSGGGSCSLTFNTPGPRTITVLYAGDANFNVSSAMVTQTVNGAPIALVSPTFLDFGSVRYKTIAVKQVTVTNTGTKALTITNNFLSVVGGGNSNFFLSANLCPASLAPGKSCLIGVGFFAGTTLTPQTATLMITDNAVNNPQLVPMRATVVKK